MMIKFNDRQVMESVKDFAEEEAEKGNKHVINLENRFALRHYQRIAEEISCCLVPGAKILDWGCGYGHMSFFLSSLGFKAVPSDVQMISHGFIDKMGIKDFVHIDPVYLPFRAESFDAILSCGTLEHVVDQDKSLEELNRALKRNGRLFIYMLPHKFGFYEMIATLLKASDHPIKYSFSSIEKLLGRHGFKVAKFARSNLFPKNIVFVPDFMRKLIKRFYDKNYDFLVHFEDFLLKIPLVNMFFGTIELVAKKI